MRLAIRYLGFAILIAAAVGVWVGLAPRVSTTTPTLPSGTRYETLITQALSDFDTNNASALGAPQQSVVNGWIARDLLTIIAKENVDILQAQGAAVDAAGNLSSTPFDERIPALLLVGVLAICWLGLTVPAERPGQHVVASEATVQPPATPADTPSA